MIVDVPIRTAAPGLLVTTKTVDVELRARSFEPVEDPPLPGVPEIPLVVTLLGKGFLFAGFFLQIVQGRREAEAPKL